MTAPRVPLVPPSTDFLNWSAWEILERHSADLPDLGHVTVLLPSWPGARALRRRLAQHAGQHGILGPHIGRLAEFAAARAADGPVLSPLDCRLMLSAALARHPHLAAGLDRLRVADALFQLFEEMCASAVELPGSEAEFERFLQRSYACGAQRFLTADAQIVHRLWQAFVDDSGGRSPAMAYRQRLAQAFQHLQPGERVYLLGFDRFSRAEGTAIAGALEDGHTELWLHGRAHGHDGLALRRLAQQLHVELAPVAGEKSSRQRLLDEAYAETPPADATLEPPPLRVIEASGAEAEARCVDLAVRRALLDNCRDVVVLTQDRRLARRLRALLERAGLLLDDPAGWALSTSAAAALVDAWFECLEQGFHFRPLLEVLKSAFVGADRAALELLERELVYRRKLERGLERWTAAAADHPELRGLLDRVTSAARASSGSARAQPGHRWTSGLLQALRELGAEPRLLQDPAGKKLWLLLEQMQGALQRQPLSLERGEFRSMLNRAIEAETFVPQAAGGPVRLLTLEQSHNLRCDYLVVAGASRDHLPGNPPADPLFSQSVRLELGLPAWQEQHSVALARWRRVLEAAPAVLVSFSAEEVHDPAQPSPWLEALEARARRCGLDLREVELPRLAGSAVVEIADATPPLERTRRPAPSIPAAAVPEKVSASAHQFLIECPYRFFARYALGLSRHEAPDAEADRSDYGDHVHRILHAFAEAVDGMPPPFTEPVTEASRPRAQARLEELAHAEFGPALRRRALALNWQAEFHAAIPALLDWLEERPPLSAVQGEITLRRALGPATIEGKIDRLETLADGRQAVVDYKTGRVPRQSAVLAGESVQLLHYAALDPRIAQAEFLPLKDGEPAVVLDQELPELRERAERRLEHLLDAARKGAGLPAQGDDDTCEHCDYPGLCRRRDWDE